MKLCDVGEDIPLHLYKISKTERFKIFAQKYSQYQMIFDLMDERRSLSDLHYGLSASSSNGKHASTYFHVNTCTGEITDESRYVLHCRNESTNYSNSALSKKDFLASIAHDDFCIIPLDSWRQEFYDYGQDMNEIRREMMKKLEESKHTNESIAEFHNKVLRWDLLQEISYLYYSDDIQKAEQKTRQYISAYGTLPDELQDLIDKKS